MTVATAALQPLSGLDALFLQLESPEMPMHVGSLSLLALPPGHRGDFTARLRRLIGSRLHLAEAFRRKLVPMPLGVANPAWTRADRIDLDRHIRRVTLPAPGTLAQLEACVGRLHAAPLDRERPLWELVVIDGLGGALKGHVGYYAKVHHAAIDGQAGVALAQAMLDITPEPRVVPPPPDEPPPAAPTTMQRLQAAAGQTAAQLSKLAVLVPAAAQLVEEQLRSASLPRRGGDAADIIDAHAKTAGDTPLLAPRTPLNVTVSPRRAFATASLSLTALRQTTRALGVSFNDVVLATCGGALRRWLARHGGVPRRSLAAAVPFSVRADGDRSAGNQVSMMRATLATHLADPAARLAQIHSSTVRGKAVTGRVRALVPTDYPSLGGAWVVGGIARLIGAVGHRLPAGTHLPSLAPVAISNVPGPPQTLYVAGARVVHYWPVSIVVHGVALNITVQSYGEQLDIGLTACPQAVPDLRRLAQDLRTSFDELQLLAADDSAATATASARAAVAGSKGRAPRERAVGARAASAGPQRKASAPAPAKTTNAASRATHHAARASRGAGAGAPRSTTHSARRKSPRLR